MRVREDCSAQGRGGGSSPRAQVHGAAGSQGRTCAAAAGGVTGEPTPIASRETHCHLVAGLRNARWDPPQWASPKQQKGPTRGSATLRGYTAKVGTGSWAGFGMH